MSLCRCDGRSREDDAATARASVEVLCDPRSDYPTRSVAYKAALDALLRLVVPRPEDVDVVRERRAKGGA